jgi:outer membrane murein-binding lipoprotein Lpp
MRAGCPRTWLCLLLLAAACGCEQLENLRQGAGSTYNRELRQLAKDIDREQVEKIAADQEAAQACNLNTKVESTEVTPANHWQPAPLVDQIRLRAPVPVNPDDWLPN